MLIQSLQGLWFYYIVCLLSIKGVLKHLRQYFFGEMVDQGNVKVSEGLRFGNVSSNALLSRRPGIGHGL